MTTSSNPKSPSSPPPGTDHWNELSSTLSVERVDEFSAWLDEELSNLEQQLKSYVTSKSRKRNLGR